MWPRRRITCTTSLNFFWLTAEFTLGDGAAPIAPADWSSFSSYEWGITVDRHVICCYLWFEPCLSSNFGAKDVALAIDGPYIRGFGVYTQHCNTCIHVVYGQRVQDIYMGGGEDLPDTPQLMCTVLSRLGCCTGSD